MMKNCNHAHVPFLKRRTIKMQLPRVRLLSDPVLRKVCEPLDLADRTFIEGLLEAMHETMKLEDGIGLAANQIGAPVRAFILKDGESYKEYLNPEMTSQGELVLFEREACLSIPGTFAPTQRYNKVLLSWTTKSGEAKSATFEDLQAFAVQHEMDHLNGKLYIDQLKPLRRDMVLSKHRKFLRTGR
jgi:peptide deformylase